MSSTGLYQELDVTKDASTEQIRKAYKKKALLTHPDRLGPDATAEQKAIKEEEFRRVNNAYEVLIDSDKRKEYDRHGVWPPPERPAWSPSEQTHGFNYGRRPPRSSTFPDPFMSHHAAFNFSDPFTLFEQIFQGTPFARSSPHRHPFFSQSFDPFTHMHSDVDTLLDEMDRDFLGRGFHSFSPFSRFPAFTPMISSSTSFSSGNGPRWVSQSFQSSMINGVTQSVQKRIDSEGNEHITRTFPDGRQIRTINGVEQSTQQQVTYPEQSPHRRMIDAPTNRYISQPSISQHLQSDQRNYMASPPPPYATASQYGSQSQYSTSSSNGHSRRPHHRHRVKFQRSSEHNESPSERSEHYGGNNWWPPGRT